MSKSIYTKVYMDFLCTKINIIKQILHLSEPRYYLEPKEGEIVGYCAECVQVGTGKTFFMQVVSQMRLYLKPEVF